MAEPILTLPTEQKAPTSPGARVELVKEPKNARQPRILGDDVVDAAIKRVGRDHRGLLIALSK